ncbi:hypothetical protein [Streptomyces sp. CFMR 7]|uniref:hypothetical protein n=1 Tax=Streptomyces sp. CFMR 7 TaxID=1649184 RepID=UPI0011A6B13C|nr:hypothetical protein [Streptomyces sp. CFMR 7]
MTAAETDRVLPPVSDMLEPQQRGTCCVWCGKHLGVGLGTDLGEQRVVPSSGAAFYVFPRECLDAVGCSERAAQ